MSELVTLVDAEGVPKVERIPRDEIARYKGSYYLEIVIAVIFSPDFKQVLATQRSWNKSTEPGHIDHICGAVIANQDTTPEEAALREGEEEAGVVAKDLRVIASGINPYGHYRHLLIGYTDDQPKVRHPHEVVWAALHPPDELRRWRALAQVSFVKGYFEDLDRAERALIK